MHTRRSPALRPASPSPSPTITPSRPTRQTTLSTPIRKSLPTRRTLFSTPTKSKPLPSSTSIKPPPSTPPPQHPPSPPSVIPSTPPPTICPPPVAKPSIQPLSPPPLANLRIQSPAAKNQSASSINNVSASDAPVARRVQFDRLHSLLHSALTEQPTAPKAALYVSGTPGTGKTFTVNAVLTTLSQNPETITNPHIFINCASSPTATHLLQTIYAALVNNAPHASQQQPQRPVVEALRDVAMCEERAVTVVVVDEIDLLSTPQNAAALYALFELPALPRSKIIVLAIANTADLSSRLLPLLHHSPARPVEIRFPPYDAAALAAIARTSPLLLPSVEYGTTDTSVVPRPSSPEGEVLMPPVAVALAAKKVAAAGGDARLMLDVVRTTVRRRRTVVAGGGGADGGSALSIVASVAGRRGAASNAAKTIAELPTHQQLALIVAANVTVSSGGGSPVAAAVAATMKGGGGLSPGGGGRKTRSPRRVSASCSLSTMSSPSPRRRRGGGGGGGRLGCFSTATLGGLYEAFRRLCGKVHVAVVPFEEFGDFCSGALSQHALLDVQTKARGRAVCTMASRPVRLKVDVDDVRAGVEGKGFLEKLLALP